MSAVEAIGRRPRLAAAVLLGLLTYAFLPDWVDRHASTRLIVAWDVAVALHLALTLVMMRTSGQDDMRRRARLQDAGRFAVLFGVVCAVAFSVGAIVTELAAVKDMPPARQDFHILLAGATMALSWVFVHLMFAVHYAHDHYTDDPAMEFPGDGEPDYWDFAYVAYAIGMSCSPPDVSIVAKSARRVALVHGMMAFFFNTMLVSLAINIASGLF